MTRRTYDGMRFKPTKRYSLTSKSLLSERSGQLFKSYPKGICGLLGLVNESLYIENDFKAFRCICSPAEQSNINTMSLVYHDIGMATPINHLFSDAIRYIVYINNDIGMTIPAKHALEPANLSMQLDILSI